ncbi:MAG: hypothetical protein HOP28_11400 [Gemmatimonadales bacterium]|nr:hypothetical protein [Gemmatimonadales bacterium]
MACQEVRQWITKSVLVPVTEFLTRAQESCEEVRQWIEEEISKPVDQWVSKQEERCKKQPWWSPLRWLCHLVTIVVKVVVWVVVTVGKWVVTIVCQVVTTVIGIVVTLVLRVVAWAVSFLVCLFTDPWEAIKSLLDLWGIILETVEDILDFVGVLIDDVIGILDDLEHLIDSLISSLGWLGVLIGWIKGVIQFVRDLVSIVRDLLDAATDILLGILGLNLCRLLRGIGDLGAGIGRTLLVTGFAPAGFLINPLAAGVLLTIRVAGYLVAGERDTVNRLQLEQVIRDALAKAFGSDTARIARALDKVGINGAPMGLPFTSDARRMFLSSTADAPNLAALHRSGVIDLFAYAGYPSTCKNTFNEADGEVVYAGSDLKVSFTDLVTFLNNGPASVAEFHVFPISRAKFREHLDTTQRKAEALGVQLFFPRIGTIRATSTDHVPLNAGEENPPGNAVQQALFGTMGRTGVNDDLSVLPTISHFHYVKERSGGELFGLTSWFRPSIDDADLSGVSYRNLAPDFVFRWVLAHEMGHYWSLNHTDRSGNKRGADQIMFSGSTGAYVTGGVFYEFLIGGGEPRFPLDDARTAWDWITGDGAASLLP